MVTKPAARRKSSVSPARERSKSASPAPPARTTMHSSKPAVMQFQSKGARNEMELTFDRYCSLEKSSQVDGMTGRGFALFLSEMSVQPASFESFVLLWKLAATQRGCITRAEWIVAMYVHGVESIAQLRQKMPDWVKDARASGGTFLLMYNSLYDYVRGEEDRCMSLANAMQAWDVLFDKTERYAKWRAWAAANITSVVTRDLWRQVGILLVNTGGAPSSESEAGAAAALPTAIAEFLDASVKAA